MQSYSNLLSGTKLLSLFVKIETEPLYQSVTCSNTPTLVCIYMYICYICALANILWNAMTGKTHASQLQDIIAFNLKLDASEATMTQ